MSDDVGYGRPPKHTQWKKGQSGNPHGRRKRPKGPLEEVMAELAELISITERGRTKRVSKLRALVKKATAEGIKGDMRASNLILSWCAKGLQARGDDEPALTAAQEQILEAYLEQRVQERLAAQHEKDAES
jgi:hypothetical protein